MSKLKETKALRETMVELSTHGLLCDSFNQLILLDIAESLAMIADKLCEADHE